MRDSSAALQLDEDTPLQRSNVADARAGLHGRSNSAAPRLDETTPLRSNRADARVPSAGRPRVVASRPAAECAEGANVEGTMHSEKDDNGKENHDDEIAKVEGGRTTAPPPSSAGPKRERLGQLRRRRRGRLLRPSS